MSRCLPPIGPVPLAVTTNLNINFLRKPGRRDLIAEARLLKLGKRLAVGEVTIRRTARTSRSPMSTVDLFDPATRLAVCVIIIPFA